ncbi:CvpA family protein [Candidatus Roizmanbacteria bacterium]|nr:CvpA family protein [Candidatus Roizmanbacteria bacterium]
MFDQLIEKFSLRGNWIDLMFIVLLVYFVLTQKGFIYTFLEAIAFIFSLIFSYKFYSLFGLFLTTNFSLPKGMAQAAGFFLAWFLAELIFSVVALRFLAKLFDKFQKHPLNVSLGIVAAIIQASTIFLFFVSLIFVFPVRGDIKKALLDSRSGPFFVDLSRSIEKQIKNVFGEAVNETLNFLTIRPESNERVDLGIKPQEKQLTYDVQTESIMFDKVNQERATIGAKQLTLDTQLRDVARAYAMEMFTHGFFSHISSVDGSSPADRVDRAGINYFVIGENLAFAPDVYIAHEGLMNSEGHRRNILSQDFGRIGIGVVDGGIYGKMFVQEFAN